MSTSQWIHIYDAAGTGHRGHVFMAKAGRSRVPVKLEAAGDTHIGGRTHNEDAILLRPDLNLFLVADGAGGQNAGNVASSLAITTIAHFFEQTRDGADALPAIDALGLHTPARRLSAAVQDANVEILEIAKTSDKHKGMGTTIVAALFDLESRLMHLAYVGDSRCYRLREGRLEQLTHDHSLINDVLELRPNISDDRVKRLPQNVITRALGMMDNLRVSVRSHDVSHGDRYLLCSDGLSDNVDDGQILESLALDIGCDEQVELLMSMALEAGARDNVATVIIDCALSHAKNKTRASTRPVKKKSRPKMARVDLRSKESANRLTEESIPEIVLYDRPESRDSSPLIHVVPEASRSVDVVQALQGVLDDDQVTKEYESPLAAMTAVADPTGGEPPIRSEPPAPARKAASGRRDPATKIRETDHAKLRQAAGKRLPDPTGDDIADDLTQDPPTKVVGHMLKPQELAAARTKERARKAAEKAKARASAKSGALGTPRKSSAPRTTIKPGAAGTKRDPSADSDGTERGGSAARVRSSPSETQVSAPRLNKRDVSTDTEQRSPGDTQKPPGASDSPPPADSTPPPGLRRRGTPLSSGLRKPPPPLPDTRRPTLTGPIPDGDLGPDADGLPVPPVREPFDTSDFTNDSVPCHACGSIIMRTADLCMYCGAPTGFVLKDD